MLGANDGIVSTASIIVGVAAASSSRAEVVTAGVAGLGGAPPLRGAIRVGVWGIAAMLLTMLVGRAVGTAV